MEAWSAGSAKTRAQAEQLDRFKGSLGKDAGDMLKALATISDVRREAVRLFVYAGLQGDEDLRVAAAQERRQQAQALQTLIDEKTAWVAPEIIALGQAKVESFLEQNAQLARRFDFFLKNTLRGAPHTLGPEAEAILAHQAPVITTNVGAVEDWTITNRALETHAFHMHQIHFLLLEVDGKPVAHQDMRDTIEVPYWTGSGPYHSVKVRMDFRDPTIAGTFVFHCHILLHEDLGMMHKIQVNP